ncbi:MAG: hypothetical protein WD645_02485, partial [Dehalococcoidia bacterium]
EERTEAGLILPKSVVEKVRSVLECYIREGENGYVFKTDDLDDLVAKMETMVKDRDGLMAMGACSYRLVVEEHAPERYAQALVAIALGQAEAVSV